MTALSSASSFDVPFDGDLRADLELSLRLADAADAASMPRFDSPDLDVQAKPDASFVTEADIATEEAIRAVLARERPDDGIHGEEFGTSGSGSRQWIIDPIDGTHNYLKGIPMWSTLIALAIDGIPRVGVVSQPAIGRRWWAASALGAWTSTASGDTRRISVSDVDSIERASVSFQSIEQWRDAGELDALGRLTSAVWRDRGYGDAWPYMLLAEGRLELVAEFGVQEYDIAAHVPIVLEAGGSFTAYSGAASLTERSSLATNGTLHQPFLDLLHSP
ncbi:inositol monophosphatase family protein [Microbacterium sp. NPDC055357]